MRFSLRNSHLIRWLDVTLTLQTGKIVCSSLWDDQTDQKPSCYLTGAYLLKAAAALDSDLWLRDHPFREFFIDGLERLHQKGETADSP